MEALIAVLTSQPGLIVSAISLVVVIVTLITIFSSPKEGKNPFSISKPSSATSKLETDQKKRDAVLKQGFQSKLVPNDLDAIVVGSGIGGLTTAALLAKAGQKVLVLEQHDQAGGSCHTFIEDGFEFDVGIHYIGEMRNNTLLRLLVNQLTDGKLKWSDLVDEFDVVALGEPGQQKFYPFRAGGADVWKKAMLEKFPKEEKALDQYLQLLREVRKSMMGMMLVKVLPKWIVKLAISTGLIHFFTKYFKYARQTVQEVLDQLTDNPDLKAVLAYSWGDYGCAPNQGSFALHASLINHYLYGASYPLGGASEIAFNIIPVIERTGGRVLVRAAVTQILSDNSGRAIGVRVAKGSKPVDIFARNVVSDAGVTNTFFKLLPKDVARKSDIPKLLTSTVKPGVGCMSLFVGLNGTASELGLKGQNVWAYTSNDLSGLAEDFMAKTTDDCTLADIPLLFISFPSAKDPTFNDRYPGKSVCTVITLARWDWFSTWESDRVKNRAVDYKSLKTEFGRRMWDQVLALFPQLADKVEYFDIGTPLSNKYYLGSNYGEIYGLDHSALRFGTPQAMMHLRPHSGIPGLYLTGQDILSCGFAGAMMGGLLSSSAILNRNLFKDLIQLKQDLAKNK